ncbi:UNVERIFIED_CONTAM: hypothetical protein FKN15_031370 [Acipenser sinensis]
MRSTQRGTALLFNENHAEAQRCYSMKTTQRGAALLFNENHSERHSAAIQ